MKGNALAETRLRVKERFEESFEGKSHHFYWPLQFCQRSFISLKGKCVLITSLCLAHHAWLNFKVRWTKKSSFVRTTTISISFCQLATVAKKQDNLPSLQNNYQFAKGSKFCPVSIFVSLRAESAVGVASGWDSRSKPPAAKTTDTDSKTQRHKPYSNLTIPKIYDVDPDSLSLNYHRPVKFPHQA